MTIRTQFYDFTVTYQSDKSVPIADLLSRQLQREKQSSLPEQTYEDIKLVTDISASVQTYKELVKQTQDDAASRQLKYYIDNGWPNNVDKLKVELLIYQSFKDEFITGAGRPANNCSQHGQKSYSR